MTLISMLIALIIERLAVRSNGWQLSTYMRPLLQLSSKAPLLGLSRHPYGVLLWWLLPAIVLQLGLIAVNFWLFDLIASTVVLLVCIGSWHYRKSYKQYLNAAGRQDNEAAFLTMQQMANDQGINNQELTHGQQLVWINFKYYAAVLFWYTLLGAFGAVAYACLRQLAEPNTYSLHTGTDQVDVVREEEPEVELHAESIEPRAAKATTEIPSDEIVADDIVADELAHYWQGFATDLCHWAEWLPIRIFGLGLALVGHFSRASGVLLSYLGDTKTSGLQVYTDIARAAEPLPEEALNCSDESCSLVQLAKRNVLFFLALVAVLTLGGWLS